MAKSAKNHPASARPILFSGPMVAAMLNGTKSQTRRIVKPQPEVRCVVGAFQSLAFKHKQGWLLYPNAKAQVMSLCRYGAPGDYLYVREAWAQPTNLDPGPTFYRADYPDCVPPNFENVPPVDAVRWRPSIHMERAASRLTLRITDVRIERLQSITEADCAAEGWPKQPQRSNDPEVHADAARDWYQDLWGTINGKGSWEQNPWVWAVRFETIQQNVDAVLGKAAA